jgi:hypothetical protein
MQSNSNTKPPRAPHALLEMPNPMANAVRGVFEMFVMLMTVGDVLL